MEKFLGRAAWLDQRFPNPRLLGPCCCQKRPALLPLFATCAGSLHGGSIAGYACLPLDTHCWPCQQITRQGRARHRSSKLSGMVMDPGMPGPTQWIVALVFAWAIVALNAFPFVVERAKLPTIPIIFLILDLVRFPLPLPPGLAPCARLSC